MTSTPVSTTKSSSTVATKQEVDGKALFVHLASTLLELGLTLAASYYFSRWIAKKIQGDSHSDHTLDDLGIDKNSGGNVVTLLQRLLTSRHEATLKAMMEELEEHQMQWKEEQFKSGEAIAQQPQDDEQLFERLKTEQQYAALSDELTLQHQESMSYLSSLSTYELSIAQSNVIDPSNLTVTFSDIGGMDQIKSEIYDLVVLPLVRPDLFMSDSGLVSPPKGILLYGPPGTGKTMLAKAIAKESHATFVNVSLSSIMNKWFGESNKLISATFNLARKLAPSVVFIDEIDSFLSQRDSTEGSAVNSMKSEFLTLWDGLLSEKKNVTESDAAPVLPSPPIIVLGATNRPYDVDPAILRRLPRSFEIALPNYDSRLQLLNLFLQKQSMTEDAKQYVATLAKQTEGYSGSDLKEVCRAAAWEPVRELTSGASRKAVGCLNENPKQTIKRTSSGFPPRGTKARPVSKNDFVLALQKVKKTGESAMQFQKKEFLRKTEDRAAMEAEINKMNGMSSKRSPVPAHVDIQKLMAVALAAMGSVEHSNQDDKKQLVEDEGTDGPPDMTVDGTS
ncbi:hypothetical protein HJC23_002819 [Cyclotella cryptica]|uniref:AAA+ ATPase domain-containing protein n=1 Tax=Cyclotella cryptica TaxID=29204 RepID=A0ABD3PMG0_9STRA|eukprot:CCRYP_013095-RA/>CCRYP_013095-RA protein AED:0.29 eAED:0.29 QI:113/1/1/1/0.5/0.4/5/1278/562